MNNDKCSECKLTKEELINNGIITCTIFSDIEVCSSLSPLQKGIKKLEEKTGLYLNSNSLELNHVDMNTELKHDYSNHYANE